jgi:hypothetical protein
MYSPIQVGSSVIFWPVYVSSPILTSRSQLRHVRVASHRSDHRGRGSSAQLVVRILLCDLVSDERLNRLVNLCDELSSDISLLISMRDKSNPRPRC